MIVREIILKTILSKSRVYEYTVNPYVGCQNGCTYCYARFMKRFSGHKEPWGQFVDVKINAPDLLRKELKGEPIGRIWISGVCDPYQPLERQYELTKKCLEILISNNWPIIIQTRSTLVLRDLGLLRKSPKVKVGLTVTTVDDGIRRIFEPNAPTISERIRVLGELHSAGIPTFAMIAPMLPKAEGLANILNGKVDHVLIDRMNYHYADWVYRKYKLKMVPPTSSRIRALCSQFEKYGTSCQVLC